MYFDNLIPRPCRLRLYQNFIINENESTKLKYLHFIKEIRAEEKDDTQKRK